MKPRSGHCMLSFNGKLYIFMGERSKSYLDDFVVYDCINRRILYEGKCPGNGLFPRACLGVSNEAYLVGGIHYPESMNVRKISGACWMFNMQTFEWRSAPEILIPRFSHQIAFHEHKLYVFGGNDELENTD